MNSCLDYFSLEFPSLEQQDPLLPQPHDSGLFDSNSYLFSDNLSEYSSSAGVYDQRSYKTNSDEEAAAADADAVAAASHQKPVNPHAMQFNISDTNVLSVAQFNCDDLVVQINENVNILPTLDKAHATLATPVIYTNQQSENSSNNSTASDYEIVAVCDDMNPLKLNKLARKAELARLARKRKKCKLMQLESHVLSLQQEIKALKQTNQTLSDTATICNNAQSINPTAANCLAALNLNLANVAAAEDEKNLSSSIDSLLQYHCAVEVSAMKDLHSLESFITPCLPLQFLSWLMNQSDCSVAHHGGLWAELWSTELHLDPQQLHQLVSLRMTVRKQLKYEQDTVKAYKKLCLGFNKHLHQQTENFERLRAILSPAQFAKYIQWTQQYGAVCIKINNQ
jgi:hypothetical protein